MNTKKELFEKTPINKLLFKMALPSMIGMLVISLYNIVDSIFIGHYVGTFGFAAIIIIFPIILFLNSLSIGLGLGASSFISLKLGEKDLETSKKIFINFILLILFLVLFFSFFIYIFIDKILFFLGATGQVLVLSKEYLSILVIGLVFQMFSSSSNSIIRTEGSSKIAMTVMIIGTISNIIFDSIFTIIFHLGIQGIALATVLAQFLSFLFTIWYFNSKNNILRIKLKNLKLDFSIIKKIIIFGFPTFLRQISMVFIIIITNNLIKLYGSNLILSAYGLFFQLLMLILMPSFGILQGAQPIIGYNYGAKKYLRVKETLKSTIKFSTLILILTYLIIMFFPQIILKMFSSNLELIDLTSNISKILLFFMPLLGFQFIVSGFLQSIGKIKISIFTSLLRQIIVLIPLILILSSIFKLNGIWYAYPISDLISFIISYFIFKKEYKKLN